MTEKNQERVMYMLNNMADAVCLANRNGELLYMNPAAKKLFGFEKTGNVKLWNAIPYVEENDALMQLFIDGVVEKEKLKRAEVEYVNNEGKRYQLHVTLTCESEEAGMVLVLVHDLTDLYKVHSAFARYTSPEIADYVLTTPGGEKQGGQVREASIMMSDLRGFTAMSARLSSNDLITMLNQYFEHMAAVIQRYRGTIIEFLGDGIFVVFNAPLDVPDHASAAARCAIEMQNEMEAVNAWNREHGYPELEMGIGINSGTVVVGNIGSDKKMKYGCMGETVNLAGRLESFCLGGEVYISENTRALIPEDVKIIGENTFMPKGGTKEMRSFRIAGVGTDCAMRAAEDRIRWKGIPKALSLECFLLDGKTVSPKPYAGFMTDISGDERFGMLATDSKTLQPLQNLMLRINGTDIYAKVTEHGYNGYVIGFTMKPDNFRELFDRKG